jgi:hypothetical protein
MEEFLNKCQLLDSYGFSKEIDQIDNNLIKIAQGVVKKPVSLESRLNLLEQKIKKMEQALGGIGGEVDQFPNMIQNSLPNPNIAPAPVAEAPQEPEL